MNTRPRTLLAGLGLVLAAAVIVALLGRGDEPAPAVDATDSPTTTATTRAPEPSTAEPPEEPDPSITELSDLLDEGDTADAALRFAVESLSPEQLASQLLATGLTGTDAPTRLRDTVGTPCLGGVFVTESNDNWTPIDSEAAATAAIAAVNETASTDLCTAPPLIMTDAELGTILRVPVAAAPATGTYADTYAADQYETLATLGDDAIAFATALRDIGIDVNFGTVADVDTDPNHFMARGGRTFGSEPEVVAALASTLVEAHCTVGIAATMKHFPNQGQTPEDPHSGRSVAAGGIELWRTTGRPPYVETRAPLVMTGHIFMDIDEQMPASLSHTITTGLLREELGYDGVVITDDLSTMQGSIDVVADAGGRAVAAINAGADLVLFVNDSDARSVIDAIIDEMSVDATFATTARNAALRVLRLKAGLDKLSGFAAADFSLCG